MLAFYYSLATFVALFTGIHGETVTANTNIALNKPTNASSFFGGWEAWRAADGDHASGFHSASQLGSWWMVDFQEVKLIHQLKLFNRQQCCQDRLQGAVLEAMDGYGNVVKTETVTSATALVLTYDYDDEPEVRYVKVSHATSFLNFAELEAYGGEAMSGLSNIATGKTTSSSTPQPEQGPSNAIDTNPDTIFHSEEASNAYWQIDFESTAFIRQITIINRQDCCQDRMIGAVLEIMDDVGSVVQNKTITEGTNVMNFGFRDLPEGRFVRLSNANNYLHFAEIEIYGGLTIDGLNNIALNRPVTSSGYTEGLDDSSAVDGHPGSAYESSESQNVWWEMDFGTVIFIRQITIYNREGCCKDRLKDAVVSILDVNRNVIRSETINEDEPDIVELKFYDDPQGRFIRISQDNNYLNFGEIEVYGDVAVKDLSNLALHKPADSTSVVSGYEASKAVDGNLDSSYHTHTDVDNWWMVDLKDMALIRQIKIYNRLDCCMERLHGAVVSVLDESKNVATSITISADEPNMVQIDLPDIPGQYVGITLDNDFLHVNQVEVYGIYSTIGLLNLALNKPAEQSSTFGDSVASKAVDGSLDSISQTESTGDEKFWIVDLEAVALIRQIKIHNRQDCCKERLNGAKVSILDDDKGTTLASEIVIEESPDVVVFNFGDIEGRFVKISIDSANPLHVSEVEVYGTWRHDRLPNVALYKEAYQSTTYDLYAASNAVDGNFQTITHTIDQMDNWWYVDLAALYTIRQIKVYNRYDCCKDRLVGAIVKILDADMAVVEQRNITQIDHVVSEFEFADVVGKYVRVELDTHHLHLSQVEVYGYLG